MFETRAILLIVAATLAGCGGSDTVPDPAPTDTTVGSGSDTDSDWETAGDTGEDVGWNGADDPSAGELGNVIYFEFDSSEVRPEDTEIVTRHALQLAENPTTQVRLEGHADERGSREYNIGLGERRAQAVRRLLLIQGAAAGQISTVSFGEERPAMEGSSEEAYAENRRVEIRYTN
jgi:peptidoglycan-associated lipoprotein